MTAPEAYLAEQRSRFEAELADLLRIPSISSLPEYREEVQNAAQWVAARMERAGIEHVQIMPTGGHPVVYGDWLHAPDKLTVLVYGHFDVQPVDPIEEWTRSPFAAEVQDGYIHARGSADSKGNVMITLAAIESLLQGEGSLPVNVKFLYEGQEEIGSPQLPSFIGAHQDVLACDLVLNSDGGQWAEDQPSLGVGLKGLCGIQIDVRGAKSDLHSGMHGGVAPNPIHALVRILDSCHDANGTITVPGFYDDVQPLTPEERAQIAAVPLDDAEYRARLGVQTLQGEREFTTLERLWTRPTLEINGIWGGFQGEGVKTVIPCEAHAKVTCRLVPNQDPDKIVELLGEHVRHVSPPGFEVSVTRLPGTARPYLIPPDHWANQAAAEVLGGLYGKPPYYVRSGGSVPVCEIFKSGLGAYTVSMGFGLPDEQIHAPNEFFRLASFSRGQHAWVRLLQRLGDR